MVDCPPTRVPRMAPHTIHEPERPPVVKLLASFTLRPEKMLTVKSSPTVSKMPIMCTVVNILLTEKAAAKVRFFYDIQENYRTIISSVNSHGALPVARCHAGMVGIGMACTLT